MRIPLFWHNTFHNKRRTLMALGGITFSLVLIFMQLTFLKTARRATVHVFSFFDYDLIVTSARYESLMSPGSFDKARLYQAGAVQGVGESVVFNYEWAWWRDPDNNNHMTSCMVLGFDLNPDFVRDEATKGKLACLLLKDNVILDEWSHPSYGEKRIGKRANINRKDVTVAGLYQLGINFQAEGSVLASLDTFQRIVRRDPRKITFGLIKVTPGAGIEEVKARLRSSLPADVLIFDRQEFIQAEQDYFIKVKPIGIMFQAGVFVAFSVGAVILYQVLSTEISNRLREFATLKAIGFSRFYLYKVGAQQTLTFAVLSYLFALPIGHAIAFLVTKTSLVHMTVTWELSLLVLLSSLLMSLISGALALGKVRKAAPADLF